MILNMFSQMFDRLASAFTTKAHQKTVGKVEAKISGAQAKAQQKALRSMDKGFDAVGNQAKGAYQGGAGGGPPQGGAAAPGQPYAAVNAGYTAPPGAMPPPASMPPQAQGGAQVQQGRTCPNGHPLNPSWDVCPYCRTAADQGVNPVNIQPGQVQAGAVAGRTVAIDINAALGTEHVNKPVVGWLVAMKGPQKGQDFRLHDGRNVMGTAADCDVVVYDQFVSARHCVLLIESNNAQYVLQDLESRNKTFVNNRQIMKQDMIDNDEIRLGQAVFRFKSLY